MRELTREKLQSILEDHVKWLNNDGGCRANLSDANLRGADLRGADLRGADLRSANLSDADLSDADLRSANLSDANLSDANLSDANLSDADLRSANLRGANLRGANLRGAENLDSVFYGELASFFAIQCPEEGSFTAWKKCQDSTIVKLLIPEDAKRSSATSRKCRASKAVVLSIYNKKNEEILETHSNYDESFIYKVGETVSVNNFDDNRWNECASGVHFFITRKEAEQY